MSPVILLFSLSVPPVVHHVTKVELSEGAPMEAEAAERQLTKALAGAFFKPVGFSGRATGFSDLKKGDFQLLVQGRYIEEIERFTVYLRFGPGQRTETPTFFAAETSTPLQKGNPSAALRAATTAAGQRLARVVKRWWSKTKSGRALVWDQNVDLWRWGRILPPEPGGDEAVDLLVDVENEDDVRAKALEKLEPRIFDELLARDAALRCVLLDPSTRLRKSCAQALTAVARSHVPTQRILLYALRTEVEDKVLDVLLKLSESFVGLSKLDTLATWLHMVKSEATTESAAEDAARLLGREDLLPNLGLTVAACLGQDSLIERKRTACARNLVEKLPFAQRRAAVETYLLSAPVYSDAQNRTYQEVMDAVFDRRTKEVDAGWSALLLKMAGRKPAYRARPRIIAAIGRHAQATAATLDRLARLGRDRRLAESAIRAIVAVARRNPSLAPAALESIQGLEKNGNWGPRPNRQDPRRAYKDAVKRLGYIMKKKR